VVLQDERETDVRADSFRARGYVRDVHWAEIRQRTLTLLLGVGFVASGLWGAMVVFIFAGSAAQPPNAAVPDGDPCCPIPNSWTDVAVWSGWALLAAGLDAVLLTGGGACLVFAARHRRPGTELARVPLYTVAAIAAMMATALSVRLL
jgi:hypothetical protein